MKTSYLMNRNTFRSSPEVSSFTHWLTNRHRTLSIELAIKSTRFVPGGIRKELTGLDALISCYRWRASGTETGDWEETKAYLRRLGDELKESIDGADDGKAFEVCREIFAWGGDRNPLVGAFPYLSMLRDEGKLAGYLDGTRRAFTLDDAVIDDERPAAMKMNSMLTKVHALASDDGLPIYDSRVAAAIAALVELWRREEGKTLQPLPAELTFPAVSRGRSVRCLFADAQNPGLLQYTAGDVVDTATRWSASKIRLGWLMSEVLERSPALFAMESRRGRMHAFEASLFMIGYDILCMKKKYPGSGTCTV
jgi:hypothetical protein